MTWREYIERLASGENIRVVGRITGKTFTAAHVVAAAARQTPGGIMLSTPEGTFHVPPGTPWQEALPVKVKP